MVKCNHCGKTAEASVSMICRECGYVMLPVKKYKKKYEPEREEKKEEIEYGS